MKRSLTLLCIILGLTIPLCLADIDPDIDCLCQDQYGTCHNSYAFCGSNNVFSTYANDKSTALPRSPGIYSDTLPRAAGRTDTSRIFDNTWKEATPLPGLSLTIPSSWVYDSQYHPEYIDVSAVGFITHHPTISSVQYRLYLWKNPSQRMFSFEEVSFYIESILQSMGYNAKNEPSWEEDGAMIRYQGTGQGDYGYITQQFSADSDYIVLEQRVFTSESLLPYNEVLDEISRSITITDDLFLDMQTAKENSNPDTPLPDNFSDNTEFSQQIEKNLKSLGDTFS
ncbi:MAG: hypothetical protein JXA44_04655 [Methanospirillaceae archaeon]|nr:hypothetical protein [Methanospirillaceae archaeon]